MITTLRHRALVVAPLLWALTLAGCGSSSNTATNVGATVGASTTSGVSTTAAPTTTIMPTCDGLAAPKIISAAVGIPVAPGQVTGSGTCQYLGLNDQAKFVSLSKLTAQVDQANWNDLQTSLGAPTPFADAALPTALLGVDGSLWVTSKGAVYIAQVNVTGGAAIEQAPQAAALLKAWLAG
jgi:hypothetical protein